ncbi:MAG: hypothetical protein M3Y59_14470 [Myxococcota bacterium]|nr:hypothetical protein [Myxococcota bacterium]
MSGFLFLGGTGCFSPPPEALARLEEVKAEGETLTAAVDGLEERFLGNQANLALWNEMARRHRTVSQVACKNHTEHFDQMVQKIASMEEKARTLRRRRVARVDSAEGTVTASTTRRTPGGRARN